ncbi:MAG TPA: ABC transporter substrate-binding protein [Candidatus Binatia bacterium]|nr:ABC transporter substrate-binding protein [Candidatus Binatia bacterium]
MHERLSFGSVVSLMDAFLLCLGLTGTVAALAPAFLRILVRVRPARREGSPATARPGRFSALALLASLLPAVGPALAADTPTERVREQVQRVLHVLEDPALRGEARGVERRAAIQRAAGELFDFSEITRRVVGPHWHARTPAEREEIVQLFTALLARSYLAKIEMYSGEKVVYAGETLDGDHAAVRTRIVTRAGTEIPMDYRLLRARERWVVYDVTIEGVSLVANYRTQFNRILQNGSHAELVRRLKARLEEPAAPASGRHAAR